MENKLSVIIVDDFEMSRLGIRYMLKGIGFIETIREAENSKQLYTLIKEEEPDLILMDVQLGAEFGFDITRQVLNKYPDTYIIAVTSSTEVQHFSEMMEAGAVGFLLKNVTHIELEKAINKVLQGEMYFSKEFVSVANKLVTKQSKRTKIKLSEREKEVLFHICQGCSNQEIAGELELSTHTVDAHRKKLLSKIGARNTASMIMMSIRDGLIDVDAN